MPTPLAALFAKQRAQFPALVGGPAAALVHLNNAAGSALPASTIDAMTANMSRDFANEGAVFRRLKSAHELIASTRAATADLIGASPDEVGLAGNTTANLVFFSQSLAQTWRPGDRVFVCESAHETNISPWLSLRERGLVVEIVPMLDDTHSDYEWIRVHLDERVRLVAVGASSNITGTITDVNRVAQLCRPSSALVCVDAANFAPHARIDVREMGADLCFFSLYKFFGPHLGAFYIKKELCDTLTPVGFDSGAAGAAARYELGARHLESIAGWAATLGYLERLGVAVAEAVGEAVPADRRAAFACAMSGIEEWERVLCARAETLLADVPDIHVYQQPRGDERRRLGFFSFNIEDADPFELAVALERAGIEAVCGVNGSPRTLSKLAARFDGMSLRYSIAHYNSEEDIDRAVEALTALFE